MVAESAGDANLTGGVFCGCEVLGVVGRGGMGTVYLAREVSLSRHVALKVLHDGLREDAGSVRDFLREAQVTAPLKHPNMVRVFSAGVEDGHPYIIMEYVAGESLDVFLQRKGRISWESALHIGGQLASALHCAHLAGIVHRDVKPSNMILDRCGQVHLTDFGIAQVSGERLLGEASGFVGTPQFMSPEQFAGEALFPASDLFSLGVVLYSMMSGCLPFESNSPVELAKMIGSVQPPRLNKVVEEIPDDVARLVAHLLEKRPEARPKDARTVCVTIEWLLRVSGNQSAWPTALSAFVREQGDVNTLQYVKKTPGGSKRQGKSRSSGIRRALLAASLVLFGCGAFLAGFSGTQFRAGSPSSAELLGVAEFAPQSGGAWTMTCTMDGYEFSELRWVGDRPVVMARVAGVKGLLTQDAFGLAAVNVESRECLAVEAPMGPGFDAGFARLYPESWGLPSIPAMPAESPLHETVLTRAFEGIEGRREGVLVLAHRWDEAGPRKDVLYRRALEGSGAVLHAEPSPDGHTVCLVLSGGEDTGDYLAERDVRLTDRGVAGAALTSCEGAIVPGSVQYSPDGRYLGYLRGDGAKRELWVLAREGTRTNGFPVAIGPLGRRFAFSPDGQHVALVVETVPGAPEVRVSSVANGAFEGSLGPGTIGTEPWYPSGESLAVAAPDSRGEMQVWTVNLKAPQERRQLTAVSGGVQDGCAVSRDGRWVAAIAAGAARPTLVFVSAGASAKMGVSS